MPSMHLGHLSHKLLSMLALSLLIVFCFNTRGKALTLEEAIENARENLPAYQASQMRVESSRDLHKASLSPYVPTVDVSAAHRHHDTDAARHDLSTYDVTLSYLLFDGGSRRANRDIARLNLDIDREDLSRVYLDLEFDVKSAFFSTMAREQILQQRKIRLEEAHKDYEVAEGRHRLGAARLSDVLQASVRLEQARFNLTEAEGLLRKGFTELNSLMGIPLERHHHLRGELGRLAALPPLEELSHVALHRPELKQTESLLHISKSSKSAIQSRFFPTISANSSFMQTRRSAGLMEGFTTHDASVELRATWNLFELDKFYRARAARSGIMVSERDLEETERQIRLDVAKAYEELVTALKSISVAESQVAQAEQNYSQAFGEYRVGRGDILSLVQAGSFLAQSREQLIFSRLNLALAKALLERNAGVETLENLIPVSSGNG